MSPSSGEIRPVAVGYSEFEFDLPGALLTHLLKAFDNLQPAPLTDESLECVQDAQGIYQIWYRNDVVYIGKTDADAGLKNRLSRHARKIQHRHDLDPCEIYFKAVRIYVFTAMDLETGLIKYYTRKGGELWNNGGFGANDPGHKRDNTRPSRWDIQFPINVDFKLVEDFSDAKTAAEVLTRLKNVLPYTFRFETQPHTRNLAHTDLIATKINLPSGPLTARQILKSLVSQLSPGWQATVLSFGVILYKEENHYPHGSVLARSK